MFQDEFWVLKKYLKNNLIKDFIQVSSSLMISLILFVKKSDEKLRFCVDYRNLNVMTVKNWYSLSFIQETLNQLTKIKYYIKLNIIAVFNKLQMTYEDEWKIAFWTWYELYKYNILLFKLINESSSFQNFINDILHNFLDVFCIMYMNDILIYSNSKKKHTQYVHQILEWLRVIELQINIEKCKFSVIKVKYLNLIIIINEIKMNSEKINVIINWVTFQDVKDVQSFLSFVNFYKWFIKKFFKLIESLTVLIRKDQSFNWTQKYQFAFN